VIDSMSCVLSKGRDVIDSVGCVLSAGRDVIDSVSYIASCGRDAIGSTLPVASGGRDAIGSTLPMASGGRDAIRSTLPMASGGRKATGSTLPMASGGRETIGGAQLVCPKNYQKLRRGRPLFSSSFINLYLWIPTVQAVLIVALYILIKMDVLPWSNIGPELSLKFVQEELAKIHKIRVQLRYDNFIG
jgi:hypothetical protein